MPAPANRHSGNLRDRIAEALIAPGDREDQEWMLALAYADAAIAVVRDHVEALYEGWRRGTNDPAPGGVFRLILESLDA